MRYLSLFSGIESASVAWKPLGWECVGVAETLEYQSAILKHHYPQVPNLGDVTKITEETIISLGKIDVVVFGSPCQDMSVAGKRGGIDTIKEDTNHSSNLFFEGVRVFRLAQKYCGARYMLWENVAGALSSKKGEDFGKVLSTLVGCRFDEGCIKWGTEGIAIGEDSMCEWAVLDAKWFGVPQRRRRVFALLDTGDWRNRKSILLEAEHMRKIVSSDEVEKQKDTCGFVGGFGESVSVKTFDRQAIAQWGTNEVASIVSARDWKSATDLVAYGIPGNWIGRKPENGGNSVTPMYDCAPSLTATDRHAVLSYKPKYSIRRLTPTETERLQGFPDGYTNIVGATPSKRYNVLGRSMAVPVMRWIGERIAKC